MFQLIIAAIAIAIIAVITIASIWYGGVVFGNQSSKARYAQYLNHAQQIESALKYYKVEKGVAPTGSSADILAALIGSPSTQSYLANVPIGEWKIQSETLYRKIENVNTCTSLNKAAGFNTEDAAVATYQGCPPCDNTDFLKWPACRREEIVN